MSKAIKTSRINFEKAIMTKVKSNEISMRPRWYFVLGSLFAIIGLISFTVSAVFLTNLTFFLLRKHGPMAQWRLQQLLTSFPLWIPIVAVVCIMLGIWLLRKYDFSYKKNFLLIVTAFIASIILAALVIEKLALNDVWSRKGPMRRFYQRINEQDFYPLRGQEQRRRQNEVYSR